MKTFRTSLLLLVGCQAPSMPAPMPPAPSARCDARSSPLLDPPEFYESNPTLSEEGESPSWNKVSPPSAGIDPAKLDQAAAELEALPFTTSFLVSRRGDLVYERYFHDASPDDSNNVHSASKGLLGLLTGVAIEQGLLGLHQPVHELLPEAFEGSEPAAATITIEHLLTMTAGFDWVEDETEYELESEPNWVAAIAHLPIIDTPGERFLYSTGQTHLLGAALAEATQTSLCDYAHQHLLTPLGLEAERWGRDPQGYYSGGYNLYLTPRELLRFGELVEARGAAEGVPLVPDQWVEQAVHTHTPEEDGYGFGYGFWLWGDPAITIAWGYGGQLVYVVPDEDLVVVITTNTRDFEPDYDGTSLVLDLVANALD